MYQVRQGPSILSDTCSTDWWLVTDVSGQPITPIFKGQAILFGLLKTSVTNKQSTPCNIPEELTSYLHSGGSLKSRRCVRKNQFLEKFFLVITLIRIKKLCNNIFSGFLVSDLIYIADNKKL